MGGRPAIFADHVDPLGVGVDLFCHISNASHGQRQGTMVGVP